MITTGQYTHGYMYCRSSFPWFYNMQTNKISLNVWLAFALGPLPIKTVVKMSKENLARDIFCTLFASETNRKIETSFAAFEDYTSKL